MSQDFVQGFFAALGLVIVLAAMYVLHEEWADYREAMALAQWFEDNDLGDG